ncbi:MAG TPA: CDP-alcohol phosphatidyltransferase family protein [Dehalococcoidia bacterium]|nr:CDP-alcohol phosphatidyltransferase family protein [Dehalococcoidia bacterium]
MPAGCWRLPWQGEEGWQLMFTMPRSLPRQVTGPVVSVLARIGVTPNMLTVAQLIGGIIAGVIIANGSLAWGGVVLLAAAALDAFDGTLARTTGRVTKFGGVFDSTIDRMFEGAVLGGLLWYYLEQGSRQESMLVFVTVVGSLCVSYVRARAEVEGVSLYDGIFTRVVRLLFLTFGLIVGLLHPILWILAVATILTAFHRLYATYQKLGNTPPGGART